MKTEIQWLFTCLTIVCLGSLILAYLDARFLDTAKTIVFILVTGMLAIAQGGPPSQTNTQTPVIGKTNV